MKEEDEQKKFPGELVLALILFLGFVMWLSAR